MKGVNQCSNTLAVPFVKEGIQKLFPPLLKCINKDYKKVVSVNQIIFVQ